MSKKPGSLKIFFNDLYALYSTQGTDFTTLWLFILSQLFILCSAATQKTNFVQLVHHHINTSFTQESALEEMPVEGIQDPPRLPRKPILTSYVYVKTQETTSS